MNIFLALVSLGLLAPTPALAGVINPLPYSTANAPLIIEAYAVVHGIPATPLIETLKCESGFVENIPGDFSSTTNQFTSWGVAQIHLPAHPDISKKEALNPIFSINLAASYFAAGDAGLWTCYRQLYPHGYPGIPDNTYSLVSKPKQ